MKIFNPIMKHVEIIPKQGGVVLSGHLVSLTDYHAVLILDDNSHEVVALKGMNISLSKKGKVEYIRSKLSYTLTDATASDEVISDIIELTEQLRW